MKKKENRLNTIIGMLREQPTLTIRELASVLDVSEMTIRRDLAKLKDSGLLVRALGMNMIGNAQQKGISPVKYDFHNEITRNSEAKRKIATNRVKMLVDIMIIVSYNSKYKAKTNKMQQKYRKILERISNESSRIDQCSRCNYFGFKYNC